MTDQREYMNSTAQNSIEIEHEVVMRALEQSPQPLTARQIRDMLAGPYRLSEDKLALLLEELSDSGKIHRFKSAGRIKQPRYWIRSIEEYARESILQILEQRPHTQTELLKKLKARLSGMIEDKQKQILSALVKGAAVRQLPAMIGSRTLRYSTRPPDPGEYLNDAIAKIGRKLGLTREQILGSTGEKTRNSSAGSQNELSEKLLTRMLQVKLAAAQGGLVPLSELWQSLQKEGWDKSSFDRLVLNLADNYRVSLHRHNFPASLTEEEKAGLVADDLGNYYVGIALR
ncbi:MAG: hypothetical protein IPL01_14170 [Acidobacteria bacterium]|nr:hypothetical protein [Acidobacteriota bacterium]MBK9707135.1 hypothetical protein [Acidobacteriota bacterium]